LECEFDDSVDHLISGFETGFAAGQGEVKRSCDEYVGACGCYEPDRRGFDGLILFDELSDDGDHSGGICSEGKGDESECTDDESYELVTSDDYDSPCCEDLDGSRYSRIGGGSRGDHDGEESESFWCTVSEDERFVDGRDVASYVDGFDAAEVENEVTNPLWILFV